MGFYIFFDYIVSFFVLIAIHAPWWAWLIYIGSALFWFVVWALIDGETNEKTANSHKNESQ